MQHTDVVDRLSSGVVVTGVEPPRTLDLTPGYPLAVAAAVLQGVPPEPDPPASFYSVPLQHVYASQQYSTQPPPAPAPLSQPHYYATAPVRTYPVYDGRYCGLLSDLLGDRMPAVAYNEHITASLSTLMDKLIDLSLSNDSALVQQRLEEPALRSLSLNDLCVYCNDVVAVLAGTTASDVKR